MLIEPNFISVLARINDHDEDFLADDWEYEAGAVGKKTVHKLRADRWWSVGGVFVRPPGVERFVLSPNNVWYGRLKLLFRITVIADDKEEPVDLDCAFVSFFYDINLEQSGNVY